MTAAFRRLLIKLSGERLAGEGGFGISPAVIAEIAQDLRAVHELGTELCVVIGGGNFIRGIQWVYDDINTGMGFIEEYLRELGVFEAAMKDQVKEGHERADQSLEKP